MGQGANETDGYHGICPLAAVEAAHFLPMMHYRTFANDALYPPLS